MLVVPVNNCYKYFCIGPLKLKGICEDWFKLKNIYPFGENSYFDEDYIPYSDPVTRSFEFRGLRHSRIFRDYKGIWTVQSLMNPNVYAKMV